MLKDWWNVDKTLIEKKPGGLYTLVWNTPDGGLGYVSTGTITGYDPAKFLKIENMVYLNPDKPFLGPMSLIVKAKRKSKMSELYICQDGYQEGEDWDWYYKAVQEAWPMVIGFILLSFSLASADKAVNDP